MGCSEVVAEDHAPDRRGGRAREKDGHKEDGTDPATHQYFGLRVTHACKENDDDGKEMFVAVWMLWAGVRRCGVTGHTCEWG